MDSSESFPGWAASAEPLADGGNVTLGGRYDIRGRLARGGMADVFLARDQVLNRSVAVKVLAPQYAADQRFVERFRREATSVAKLNHPNIVQVYDWGSHDGTYFIAMELVEGDSLAQILAAGRRVELGQAIEIARAVAAALGYAHANGIVHRDVKPGNILITGSGEVKVTDFGIARAFEGDADLTETGKVMGTAAYFSPEQAQGGQVGPQADLYSLGVVLFEMVTGTVPFDGPSPALIAEKHVMNAPPRASSLNPSVPPAIDQIIAVLLVKDPGGRYPTARELEADLARAGAARPERPSAPDAGQATQILSTSEASYNQPPQANDQAPSDIDETYYDLPSRSGWFVVALALLLVAAVVGLYSLSRVIATDDGQADPANELLTVPSVIGDPEATASNRLTDAGFEVQKRFEETTEAEPGVVFAQQPLGDTELERGSVVTIVISASVDTIEVPRVLDKIGTLAADELAALGFDVVIQREPSDTVEVDRVIRQSIDPGQLANPGVSITLTVSTGPDQQVPDETSSTTDSSTTSTGSSTPTTNGTSPSTTAPPSTRTTTTATSSTSTSQPSTTPTTSGSTTSSSTPTTPTASASTSTTSSASTTTASSTTASG